MRQGPKDPASAIAPGSMGCRDFERIQTRAATPTHSLRSVQPWLPPGPPPDFRAALRRAAALALCSIGAAVRLMLQE
jgi:hypothetical protein